MALSSVTSRAGRNRGPGDDIQAVPLDIQAVPLWRRRRPLTFLEGGSGASSPASRPGFRVAIVVTDDPFAAAAASADRLVALAGRHDVAVVLGSGWTPAADAIGPADAEVPLAELGGFPEPTVAGHAPTVRSVGAGPLRALVFLGRVHLYEGLPPAAVVHGVRTAGCRAVMLTNAAGGIRPGLAVRCWRGSCPAC